MHPKYGRTIPTRSKQPDANIWAGLFIHCVRANLTIVKVGELFLVYVDVTLKQLFPFLELKENY